MFVSVGLSWWFLLKKISSYLPQPLSVVKLFNIPKAVLSSRKLYRHIYKIACISKIYSYLQLYMQHQYKLYDFSDIPITVSSTANLLNTCGFFINAYFYVTCHIFFSAMAIVGVFIIACLSFPFWSTVRTSCLFIDQRLLSAIGSREFLMKLLHVYFDYMPSDEALL